MTREQLVVTVLLVLSLLVQFMRRLKGTIEEEAGDEAEATNIHVAIRRRVHVRELRGPSEAPRVVRPAMESFPVLRRRQSRVAATARDRSIELDKWRRIL